MAQYEDQLLDHDADGIQEYDNNLPRWWLYGFYVTIAFAAVYLVMYHVTGSWSLSKGEYDQEIAEAKAKYKSSASSANKALAALTDAPSLDEGKKIFNSTNNPCFSCHKADGGGLVGPNLTDNFWIKGCDINSVMKSIAEGAPEKGMPPYGSGAKLTDDQLLKVASYVLSLRGSNPPDAKAIDPEREKECK